MIKKSEKTPIKMMLLKTTEIKFDICRIQAKQNLLHFQSKYFL